MKHTPQFQERSSSPALSGLKKLASVVVGAVALMSAVPAMADTINFESHGPDIFNGHDTFTEGNYLMTVFDSPASATGDGGAGGIANGMDPNTCAVAACPTGNSSFYYFGVNDGGLKVERNDNLGFRLSSLDYAFLAPVGGLPGYSYGQLTLVGNVHGGGSISAAIDFPALVNGNSPFSNYNLSSAFAHTTLDSVMVRACLFDGAGNCFNPADNQAQFSIDNLQVAAVPEPETYAMLLAGLAGMGLVARRRAKQASSNNA